MGGERGLLGLGDGRWGKVLMRGERGEESLLQGSGRR